MLFLFLLLFFLQDPGICEGKYDGDCGIRKIKLKPQIAHGFAVEENEFPWHVALYRLTNTSSYDYICGGSIIDNNIVLTAAHCIYDDIMKDVDTRTIVIAAGKHNSSWEHRDEHEQRFEVIKKMLLPTYRGIETRLQDDIALLVLNSSITFSSAVMPVCVDWKNSYKPTDEDLGTVVGWGYNEKDVLSEKLQLSRMMSSNLSDCRMNIGIALSSLLTSDKICANSLYSSELKEGDSGGGLVFIRNLDKNKERYFIFGVLSVRQSSSYYCLFSSISYHLAWLESKLNTSDEAFVRQDHAPNNKLKMADNINGQNGYSMPYKVEGVEKSTANRKLDPLPANFSRDVPLGPPKQEGGGFTANQPCLWMCHLRRNLSTTQCFPISYFYIRGGWFDGMFLEILIFVVDRCTNRYYILTPTTTVVPRDLILSVMEDLNKSDLRGTPLFVKNHMNT